MQGWYFKDGSPLYWRTGFHSLPPILHMQAQNPMSSYSKGAQGLSVFLRVHGIFHRDCNFTESLAETVWRSLRHSCRSELTRQGISLP